jgi:hypothetical protein
MKFSVGRPTTSGPPQTFRSASEAAAQPLARALFAIPGVVYVFMTADFLSVNKSPESRWDDILPAATRVVTEHFALDAT